MTTNSVVHDERTVNVENASYRLAYLIVAYGLLLSIMYRGFVLKESSWDLMGLVIGGGGVASLYQAQQRVLTRRWWMVTAASAVIALIIAVALVLIRR